MYLDKCTDLVNHLMPAFETKTGIPYGQINLATGKAQNPSWARGASTLAEFGTLQMEFIALSQRTGDPRWEKMAENIVERVRDVKYKAGGRRLFTPATIKRLKSSVLSFTTNEKPRIFLGHALI